MRKIYNLSKILLIVLSMFSLSSCNDDINNEILPILGIYEAHIVGIAGPFSISVSGLERDNILIDAPFDGDIWSVVEADIDNVEEEKWDIDIHRQSLANGIEIWGDGYYYFGTLQLNYSISFFGDVYDYKLIGDQ